MFISDIPRNYAREMADCITVYKAPQRASAAETEQNYRRKDSKKAIRTERSISPNQLLAPSIRVRDVAITDLGSVSADLTYRAEIQASRIRRLHHKGIPRRSSQQTCSVRKPRF